MNKTELIEKLEVFVMVLLSPVIFVLLILAIPFIPFIFTDDDETIGVVPSNRRYDIKYVEKLKAEALKKS